ncbi:unnamed protein product [Caenorhabditis bovis]|uniref:Galectin n=1 Tax=Caenorhabditis bovis TaxID=2654633 RepID=A0A8S1EVF3_9PELO|nr:unnamed protein product [Caenorhabditis bovis]
MHRYVLLLQILVQILESIDLSCYTPLVNYTRGTAPKLPRFMKYDDHIRISGRLTQNVSHYFMTIVIEIEDYRAVLNLMPENGSRYEPDYDYKDVNLNSIHWKSVATIFDSDEPTFELKIVRREEYYFVYNHNEFKCMLVQRWNITRVEIRGLENISTIT